MRRHVLMGGMEIRALRLSKLKSKQRMLGPATSNQVSGLLQLLQLSCDAKNEIVNHRRVEEQ